MRAIFALILNLLLLSCALSPNRDLAGAPAENCGGFRGFTIRFLTAESFHIYPTLRTTSVRVPELMVVKDDDTFPAIELSCATQGLGRLWRTSKLQVFVEPAADGQVQVNVRGAQSELISSWQMSAQRASARLSLRTDESLYGFGDKRAALNQRGQKIEMLNHDAFASETNHSYKSVPAFFSSVGYGLFFHNFYPSHFDVGATERDVLNIEASAGEPDFYFFGTGSYAGNLALYTQITGRPALLPRWTFGYHQGKASYEGRGGLIAAQTLRAKKLPVDAVFYDDWSDEIFSRSSLLEFRKLNIHLTAGENPFVIGRGADMDALVKGQLLLVDDKMRPVIEEAPEIADDDSGRSDVVGYVDFFSPRAMPVFWRQRGRAYINGLELGMADFGEMDHLLSPEKRFWPSVAVPVSQIRNLYALAYTQSMQSHYLKVTGKRPSGMMRAGFAGSQRLGWSTTADSTPDYKNFEVHVRALLNLSLSGFSNIGYDIGGWSAKGSDLLYARWFAAGTFNPFMWAHGQEDREPYAHGPQVEAAARSWLNLRYRMLPYFYSLHEEAHRTGVPVLRPWPLAVGFSQEVTDQFFVGEGLLVAPVFNDQGTRSVRLPVGEWLDFFDPSKRYSEGVLQAGPLPLNRLPVYVKAGTVLPFGPEMQYSNEKPVDPLTVHYYASATRQSSGHFDFYEDDGNTYEYLKGRYQRTFLQVEERSGRIDFNYKVTSGDGSYKSVPRRTYLVAIHGVSGPLQEVRVNGVSVLSWRQEAGEVRLQIKPVSK